MKDSRGAIAETFDRSALTAKLVRLHGLSDDDRIAFEGLPLHIEDVAGGQDIVQAGQRADRCAIVLTGMAFSYKLTRRGDRQILCLHIPGDYPDLQNLHLGTADIGVAAVGWCHVGFVSSERVTNLCSRRPTLVDVLWREVTLQAASVREWLLNVGRREAYPRLAHLMCEVVERHRIAGLTSNHSCNFPLSQTALADALGLSAVHLNRTVQILRADGLIEWEHRRLTVLDWDRLRLLADFDPAYLQPDHRPSIA